MGADVYFVRRALGDKLDDSIRDELLEFRSAQLEGMAQSTKQDMETSIAVVSYMAFREEEALGDYYRASIQTWDMIVAEMAHQGMLDDGGIPGDKLDSHGEAVTPAEIEKALEDAEAFPVITPEHAAEVGGGAMEEWLRHNPPTEGEATTGLEGKVAAFPTHWVKWLAFMERAAKVGEGFAVS